MIGNQSCHLLAFYTNDLASAASNVSLGAPTDQAVTNNSTTSYFLADKARLIAAYAGNDAYTDVRINSPSLRDPFLPHIDPLSLTALPANIPPIALFNDMGIDIPANENFSVEASRGVVAASDAYALLWLSFGRTPIPAGPRFTARFTGAITGSEGVWAAGALTFADTLPAGKYAVAGMAIYGTNLLAGRLIFQGGGYRPGVLAQGAQGEWNGPAMPKDYQGKFGEFLNTVQPQLEIFCTGANTSQIGYMDLVKLY